MAKKNDHQNRLTEIADTSLGQLSDEEVLRLLAERKQLEELQKEYEKLQKEREAAAQAEQEKAAIEKDLDSLNARISPDKPDDELLQLIEERKALETKLAKVEKALAGGGSVSESTKPQEEKPAATPQKEETATIPVKVVAPEPKEETQEVVPEAPKEMPPAEVAPEVQSHSEEPQTVTHEHLGISNDESFGEQKISDTSFGGDKEFAQYLEDLRHATGSIGKILEGLPAGVKKNKAFMLEVAKIDPAYAMHYADPATLKKEEDFNVKVASIKNIRNSGSALAEMSPEARTAKVVMAGIKADYRNVRFLLPNMEEYDKMLEIAKEGALQKVRELKDSVDIGLLVPKILQKDKAFMEEIEKLAAQSDGAKKEK